MNKSIKFCFNYLLGPVLFLFLSWVLYRQISRQEDFWASSETILQSWKSPWLWLAAILLFLNWGLEARKWQLLLSHLEEASYLKAFKSVLCGVSVTMLTPNRTGEYAGRVVYVNEGHRLTAVSLTIFGSLSQLLVTILMGIIGLFAIRHIPGWNQQDPYGIRDVAIDYIMLPAGFVSAVLIGLLFFRMRPIVKSVARIRFLKSFVKHLVVLETFSRKQLLRIQVLSCIRYLVFILQYVLLLKVFGAGIPWKDAFLLLTVFYLLMAGIPTIGFSELPLRAAASVEIFSLFSSNTLAIQAAAFGIWIINLAIPALLGGFLMIGHKMFAEK